MVKRAELDLSKILFSLRMYPSKAGKLPYEQYTRVEPNTIKELVINSRQSIAETPEVKLTESDFESCKDSNILVRERTRGSNFQGAFHKRNGVLLEQTDHKITFLPAGKTKPTILSKQDVGQDSASQPCCSKEADGLLLASLGGMHEASEHHTRDETQSDSAEAIFEMMNISSTQPITEQQAEELVKTKKKGNSAMERLRAPAKLRQKKNKNKRQLTRSQQNLPTIIEIDSDEDDIRLAPMADTSIIKQENKEGEDMGERDEPPGTDEWQTKRNWQDRKKSQCDETQYIKRSGQCGDEKDNAKNRSGLGRTLWLCELKVHKRAPETKQKLAKPIKTDVSKDIYLSWRSERMMPL